MINKYNWNKQGILTVLMLRKIKTGLPDVDETYLIRTNDKNKAMQILSNNNKKKTLVSLCEQGFEIELNRRCIYIGREGVTYNADIESEKSSIVNIISKAEKFNQELV